MRGVWLHKFLQMYASGGVHTPLTKTGKKIFTILHRSFRGLPKDGNDKSIQHRGGEFHEDVLSYWQKVYETYGGKTSWKLWRMYASKAVQTYDCKTFNLPATAATLFVSFKPKWLRTLTVRALNIEEGYALTCCKHTHHRYDENGGNRSQVNHFTRASPRQPTRQLKMYERDSVWNLSILFAEQLSGDSLGIPSGLTKHKV